MPKSKRDKRVSLTQTKKKDITTKQNLVEAVRECVGIYDRVFVFSVCNMRNSKLKEVRNAWKHSRIFFGKNKVMAIALGRTEETEVMQGIHKLSNELENEVGVLFTSKSKDEVLKWFASFSEHDYARAGNVASSTVELDEGPLTQFSHAIEPHLRKLGLPVTLKKGIVTTLREHTVCKEGEVLLPAQCKILKLLNIVMTQFSVDIKCVWEKSSGELETYEVKPREKMFNKVRITSDDQVYDYVDNDMTVEAESTPSPSPAEGMVTRSKKARKNKS